MAAFHHLRNSYMPADDGQLVPVADVRNSGGGRGGAHARPGRPLHGHPGFRPGRGEHRLAVYRRRTPQASGHHPDHGAARKLSTRHNHYTDRHPACQSNRRLDGAYRRSRPPRPRLSAHRRHRFRLPRPAIDTHGSHRHPRAYHLEPARQHHHHHFERRDERGLLEWLPRFSADGRQGRGTRHDAFVAYLLNNPILYPTIQGSP